MIFFPNVTIVEIVPSLLVHGNHFVTVEQMSVGQSNDQNGQTDEPFRFGRIAEAFRTRWTVDENESITKADEELDAVL